MHYIGVLYRICKIYCHIMNMICPVSTYWKLEHSMDTIVPKTELSMPISIFMASMKQTKRPGNTTSPSVTNGG